MDKHSSVQGQDCTSLLQPLISSHSACLSGSRQALKDVNKTPAPGTLLAVVVLTKAPRLQKGKHAALKNGMY